VNYEEMIVVEIELIHGEGNSELVGHWLLDQGLFDDERRFDAAAQEAANMVADLYRRKVPHRMSAYFVQSDGERVLFQRMIAPPEAARAEDIPEHGNVIVGLPTTPPHTNN
jgi:hypothetical protein